MGTPFTDVYAQFLKLIDDPELALMSDEDVSAHLEDYLKDAIYLYMTPTPLPLLSMSDNTFTEVIPERLLRILAHAMVLIWIEPKISRERIMRTAIQDRDYSELSHANQLSTLIRKKEHHFAKVREFMMDYFYQDEDFKGFN